MSTVSQESLVSVDVASNQGTPPPRDDPESMYKS